MSSHESKRTIRRTLWFHGITASVILLVLFVGSFLLQGVLLRQLEVEKVEVELLTASEAQAQKILGSMVLPEEKASVPLMLNRIQKQEGLDQVTVNQGQISNWPVPAHCRQETDRSYVCSGPFSAEVRTLTVMKSGDTLVGVLEKTKRLDSWYQSQQLTLARLLPLPLGILTLGGLIFVILNFVRRDLCEPAKEIVEALSKDQKARGDLVKKQNYQELHDLAQTLYELQSQLEEKSVKEKLGELTRQVAHDIRSPLSLLKVLSQSDDHPVTKDERRLAKHAVRRIEATLDSVLKAKEQLEGDSDFALSAQLELLVEGKALSHRGRIEFQKTIQLLGRSMDPNKKTEIMRLVENLLDNSIEAMGPEGGSIRLHIYEDQTNLVIEVLDTGHGLSAEQLAQVGAEGFSTKPTGHGLGIYGIRQLVEQVGGTFDYHSIKNHGTLARINIPVMFFCL